MKEGEERMKPTDQLRDEHSGIKVVLGIVGKMCGRMEARSAVPTAHLEEILEFLRVFVDRCHHSKEEDHLFPALEAVGVPREGGPIGLMFFEHEQGRSYVRALGAAAREIAEGAPGGTAGFVANARLYRELLLAHIDKEDNVLYPIADAQLSPETQAALLEEFDRVEKERVGQGRHEAFHAMISRLAAEYGAD
jgi:hemerythrin-like domain-containing protein